MDNAANEALMRSAVFVNLTETTLRDLVGLDPPLREADKAHRQLAFIEKHIRHEQVNAQSVVIEDHYIDRDFMEDHSIFYSKNLVPVSNHCRRVHFFNIDAGAVEEALRGIRDQQTALNFKAASEAFASQHYLGFCVIRPLPGSPVGRTVLVSFPKEGTDFIRDFGCVCDYKVHLAGVPLRIRGLAFQQQDLGVSACATTALWSALHRARELDGGFPATPAQITVRASQFALPFGRSMPSEGLSLDQMCQAVQSLGYAPNLFRAKRFLVSRWILYSAVRSGIAPVLILSNGNGLAHAVTVAGAKLKREHQVEDPLKDEMASDLFALYVHDDRFGPYIRADIKKDQEDLNLEIEILDAKYGTKEIWRLSHILVPMHNKVRLSPEMMYHRVWAVVPLIGSGKADDPKRPMFVPSPAEQAAKLKNGDRSGIIGFSMQLSDDGKSALVEFIGAAPSELKFIVNSKAPGVKAFERGTATKAQIELEFRKAKAAFTLDSLGGRAQ